MTSSSTNQSSPPVPATSVFASPSRRFDLKIVFLAIVLVWLHITSVIAHWKDISFLGRLANLSLFVATTLKLSIPVQLLATGQSESLRKSQVEELMVPLLFTAIGSGLNKTLYI